MGCHYHQGTVYRPPSEAESFILRLTIGCSHNQCAFCTMYKEVPFQVLSQEAVTAQIDEEQRLFPRQRKVFLADGSAMVLPTDRLVAAMEQVKKKLPVVRRITAYGSPKDILHKSEEELKTLAEAGLKIIYMGIESGDDAVLRLIKKGVTANEIAEAAQKVQAAGIKLSAMIILGLGGKERTQSHAVATADLISRIQPEFLGVLTLVLQEGAPLLEEERRGTFTQLDSLETLQEMKTLVKGINVQKNCIFRSTHISNVLPLSATLPVEKEALSSQLEEVIQALLDRTIQVKARNLGGRL